MFPEKCQVLFCACGIVAFGAEAAIFPWKLQDFSEEYPESERQI
jgi:hypothetical protein